MSKSRNRIYTNGEITIYWRGSECVHATTCYVELREVFDPMKRPWVNPKGASSERIKDIIEKCPSQALMFKWNEQSRNQTETSPKLFKGKDEDYFDKPTPPKTTLTIRLNGPIVTSGNFKVIDERGKDVRKMQTMSICRCGASSSQPFCDGTHFKIGFRDE